MTYVEVLNWSELLEYDQDYDADVPSTGFILIDQNGMSLSSTPYSQFTGASSTGTCRGAGCRIGSGATGVVCRSFNRT